VDTVEVVKNGMAYGGLTSAALQMEDLLAEDMILLFLLEILEDIHHQKETLEEDLIPAVAGEL
jgi:hypothetical protein